MSEIYWKAVYNDGTELPQIKGDNITNKYLDIDRTRLKFFELWKDDKLLFRLHLEEGRRLIYRRRVTVKMGGPISVVYLVGWQQTVEGKNVQDIAYIFEDGHVELAGKWKESRVFGAPILIKCEKSNDGGEMNDLSNNSKLIH